MWDAAFKQWLGGIEPAWSMLDRDSLASLRHPPSPVFGPIRLASDLTPEEIQQSPVGRNTLILLRSAAEGSGLKRTAMGNLSRAVVAEMLERFTWPDFDKNEFSGICKVINESDFLALLFVRRVAEAARLLRRYKGHFRATPAGRRMSREPNLRALQAVLFHSAFWHLELGYVSLNLHGDWPQRDAGIVLWCLSVAAHDWQSRERLTRLCTIPVEGHLNMTWDTASFAMDEQILRPLTWFGLLEEKQGELEPGQIVARRLYRKTELFDRFLLFDVRPTTPSTPRH
jgi:hypothetical protein